MAIQFRRGAEADLVSANLLPAEPAYCTDTHKLVVGRGGGVNDLMLTETQAAQLVAATPLVASSTAGMTDETRMYVLTTDGYLYHYTGTSWVSTGVQYQSTGIADGAVTATKTNFINQIYSTNMLDESHITDNLGYWWYNNSGRIELQTNQYTTLYAPTEIDVSRRTGNNICFSTNMSSAQLKIYNIHELDSNGTLLNTATVNLFLTATNPYIFTSNANTKKLKVNYLGITAQNIKTIWLMVNDGSIALPHTLYSVKNYVANQIFDEGFVTDKYLDYPNKVKLNLPTKYNLVVGDTFELFWKGIILSNDPYRYNIKVTCAVGAIYKRRFIYTPTQTGTYSMTIEIYDDNEKPLDTKTATLEVKAKATSPATIKNILCVGDSLTSAGEWPAEVYRRITGIGGTPAGDNLSNINFIGSKIIGSIGYEGYGGWTFDTYNTESKTTAFQWITSVHGKTSADQHSLYKDGNNNIWKLETIETSRIKIICTSSAAPTFSATGTLTYISGGTSTTNIIYTASEMAAGNPFWNTNATAIDFSSYVSKLGKSGIDYCYVLLGWNSTGIDVSVYRTSVETFITNLHNAYSNCKITLVGLQIPAFDGLGANYGCAWNYYKKVKKVFEFNDLYADIASKNSNTYFLNLAGQFDTDNNMQTGTRAVNTRNSSTETYQKNGVHPALSGYYQIADAVYRDLSAKLQD